MIPVISKLPPAPGPNDEEEVFEAKSYDLVDALKTLVAETNAFATAANQLASSVEEDAASCAQLSDAALGHRNEARFFSTSASEFSKSAADASSAAVDANSDAQQAATAASMSAGLAAEHAANMAQAIAMAGTYATVPATYKSWMIVVTLPHLRCMVWSGTKYVRAPWHPAGQVVYSYGATLAGALPVRADLSYSQADYPDLAEYLGLSGAGTFSLIEARGEFIRVLDNGRGVDVGRVIRSTQQAEVGPHTHPIRGSLSGFTGGNPGVLYAPGDNNGSGPVTGGGATYGVQSNGGTEPRPRNIVLPLWISY